LQILSLSLIGGLLVLDTTAALQILISQPLIACTILGWFGGNVQLGLHFGLLIQLLWLSQLPVGAAKIPAGNLGSIAGVILALQLSPIFPEYEKMIIANQKMAKHLEEVALNDPYFKERKLFPNVDFYSGIIYRALGIPVEMFTVMFAIGRLPGWIAQWREMRLNNEPIGRPRQLYIGETLRDFKEMFETLLGKIKQDVVSFFTRLEITMPEEAEAIEEEHRLQHEQNSELDFVHQDAGSSLGAPDSASGSRDEGFTADPVKPFKRQVEKVGRNEPCPCGSGKKYKQCHGKLS